MEEAREKAQTLTLEGAAMNISCPIYVVGRRARPSDPPITPSASPRSIRPKVLNIVKGGNHVVNNRRYMYQTQAADWMGQQLGVPRT